ncbi:MAG: hypothetical protein M1834_001743 [Cirrosporium novae-zelandiae]|nr:MAG: hypothetical protein M1834_001743 [Cirrosporium novae-zelandiae]
MALVDPKEDFSDVEVKQEADATWAGEYIPRPFPPTFALSSLSTCHLVRRGRYRTDTASSTEIKPRLTRNLILRWLIAKSEDHNDELGVTVVVVVAVEPLLLWPFDVMTIAEVTIIDAVISEVVPEEYSVDE